MRVKILAAAGPTWLGVDLQAAQTRGRDAPCGNMAMPRSRGTRRPSLPGRMAGSSNSSVQDDIRALALHPLGKELERPSGPPAGSSGGTSVPARTQAAVHEEDPEPAMVRAHILRGPQDQPRSLVAAAGDLREHALDAEGVVIHHTDVAPVRRSE